MIFKSQFFKNIAQMALAQNNIVRSLRWFDGFSGCILSVRSVADAHNVIVRALILSIAVPYTWPSYVELCYK